MSLIALAEDDDNLRELLGELLQDAGFEVTLLEDGFELIDYLELAARRPDLVIADIRMPGITGIEAIAKARAQGVSCPVIVMTSQPDNESRARAAELGNTRFLAKPAEPGELVRYAREMCVRPH